MTPSHNPRSDGDKGHWVCHFSWEGLRQATPQQVETTDSPDMEQPEQVDLSPPNSNNADIAEDSSKSKQQHLKD